MKNWHRAVAGIGPFVLVIVLIVTNPGQASLEQSLGRGEQPATGNPLPGVLGGVERNSWAGDLRCENFGMFSLAAVSDHGAREHYFLGVLGFWIGLDGGSRGASNTTSSTGLPSPPQR